MADDSFRAWSFLSLNATARQVEDDVEYPDELGCSQIGWM